MTRDAHHDVTSTGRITSTADDFINLSLHSPFSFFLFLSFFLLLLKLSSFLFDGFDVIFVGSTVEAAPPPIAPATS